MSRGLFLLDGTCPRLAVLILVGAIVSCDGTPQSPSSQNGRPVADAGPADDVLVGDVIVLDGTASSDPDGDSLSYQWSLVSLPEGSAADLSEAQSPTASFAADLQGDYIIALVVDDGELYSDPDSVTVSAQKPAPIVDITMPEDLSVVTASPVTVTGTIDDQDATVTVNGVSATIGDGTYTASVDLQEGSNDITVVATNSTGETTAGITVILNTVPGPAIAIQSPRELSIWGRVLDLGVTPSPIPVTVTGVIRVNTEESGGNAPSVSVNGIPATVFSSRFSGTCPSQEPLKCFRFEAEVPLNKGTQTVTAIGVDVLGSSASDGVEVVSDYCRKGGKDEGLASEIGGQSNRCHEIDGCSVYVEQLGGPPFPALDLRNNPMPWAIKNQAPTDFGSGTYPPSEFFIHGQSPRRRLPCNKHDVCYQTVGTEKSVCDRRMLDDMRAVCRRAYPTALGGPIYLEERKQCFELAYTYYLGLAGLGQNRFDQRQDDYRP